jgi:hypothetical protein
MEFCPGIAGSNLSWPVGTDPHTCAIELLNSLFGKTDHAPVTVNIVENYLRELLRRACEHS